MVPGLWWAPLRSFVIGVLGAALFVLLGVPAPFLTGPASAVTLAALAGVKTESFPQHIRNVVFVVLGLTIGQSVTPEVLDAMRNWPMTLVLLCGSLFAIVLLTPALLMRCWSMDRATAFLASSPGHLSYVLGLTEGVKADLAMVSIVQSIRLLTLTLLVPAAIALTGRAPEHPPVAPMEMAFLSLALMIAIAAVAGFVLQRLRLPAAYLIGGMLVSVALHVSGLVEGVTPFWLAAVAFVCLGVLIGSRFSGVTLAQLGRTLGAGFVVTVLGVVLASLFAVFAHWITGMDLTAILIAFAPGGLETMAAMSVILGIDPTFVATHHVARLLMLTVIMPFILIDTRSRGR